MTANVIAHIIFKILISFHLNYLRIKSYTPYFHCASQSFHIESAPNGIGIILAGRMKGHMKTRFVPKMNALSLRSFTNTIIDIGMISSVCVKVGTILYRWIDF